MKKNSLIVLLLLLFHFCFSQNEKIISGKIVVKDATPRGVHVLNLVNEKEATSDEKGEFSILAKEDDLLVFSAIHLDLMRKILESGDYTSGAFTIEMTSKINQLEQVDIKKIDVVSLGIMSKIPKSYTPAERRLKAATSLNPQASAGLMMGASIGLDPLLNWISGRTKLLKSELVVERKELIIKKLIDYYDPEYYTATLKIPSDYVLAFQYYAAEDSKLAEALNGKNRFLTSFQLARLAVDFNQILINEKK